MVVPHVFYQDDPAGASSGGQAPSGVAASPAGALAGSSYQQQPHHQPQHLEQQEYDHHHPSGMYSGQPGPLRQSIQNPEHSMTIPLGSIPLHSPQAMAARSSNPSGLPPPLRTAARLPVAHHLQQQPHPQQVMYTTSHMHSHAIGAYSQHPTMSVPQYNSMMLGSYGTMMGPPQQQHLAKASHYGPSDDTEAAYPAMVIPNAPMHPTQVIPGPASAPTQRFPSTDGVVGAEPHESARGPISVLAAAVATNPNSYSFGQEIHDLYGSRKYNPGGMVATANLPSDEERGANGVGVDDEGRNPTNLGATAVHYSNAAGSAVPSVWARRDIPFQGTDPQGAAAGAAFQGASANGGPTLSESCAPNQGVPFIQHSTSLMGRVPGGTVSGLPPPYTMSHSSSISGYHAQGQVPPAHDPYFAIMMQHSIQQQQQASLPRMQHQNHYHESLNMVSGQESKLESRQSNNNVSAPRRERRNSGSISSVDNQSQAENPSLVPAKQAQDAPTQHESVLPGRVPKETASTQDKAGGSLPQVLTLSHLQSTSAIHSQVGFPSIGTGQTPYQGYPPQHLPFPAHQTSFFQPHQQQQVPVHQHVYSLVGGHPMQLSQMQEHFAFPPGVSLQSPSSQVAKGNRRVQAVGGPLDQKEKKRRTKSFPEKLLLSIMNNSVGEDAVAWLPDGKSFVVVNADAFVQQILRPTFKECKYASFVRKLHRWGFVRLTSGTGTDCFHHPMFQNGRLDLATKLTCTPREKDGSIVGVMGGGKPPSLAGVERFIRAKAAAAAAAVPATTSKNDMALFSSLDHVDGRERAGGVDAAETFSAVIPSTIEAEDDDDNGLLANTPTVY